MNFLQTSFSVGINPLAAIALSVTVVTLTAYFTGQAVVQHHSTGVSSAPSE